MTCADETQTKTWRKWERRKPRAIAIDNRDKEIIRLRTTRLSLELIGDRFGLTRERVRQIINKYGDDEAKAVKAVKLSPAKASRHCPCCNVTITNQRRVSTCGKRQCVIWYMTSRKQWTNLGKRAFDMRIEGKTWSDICGTGFANFPNDAKSRLIRWGNYAKVDVSAALTRQRPK